ncbi:MAG: glutamate--tRNA ligase family protein [Patescibacteria group bacterium]
MNALVPKNPTAPSQNIVTRFAPSPTGLFHVGSYRTALFSYLYARQHGGKFILRIEDTDKLRSKPEYEANIIDSLAWMGLEYDEKYRQSEQAPTHRKYLEQMIAEGKAYVSREPAKDKEGNPVLDPASGQQKINDLIRFKNPGTKVAFTDLIRGTIEMETADLKDFVIAKNLDTPLFHLAVVVDDFTEGVTHIIRGEDHISNTPRQILIQRAIGAPEPIYAHLPLVLGEDRSKLSKRKGALAVTEYRDQGFLPEALINGMALLGWNPGTDQEILSKDDLLKLFDLSKIQKGGAIFDQKKLRWINKEYLKQQPIAKIESAIATSVHAMLGGTDSANAADNSALIKKLAPVVLERIDTVGDIKTLFAAGEFVYFFSKPTFTDESTKQLLWKDEPSKEKTVERLAHAKELLKALATSDFADQEKVRQAVWKYAEEQGRGCVLWPMRFALSGVAKSPDPFTLASLLGKDETLARLNDAITLLSA